MTDTAAVEAEIRALREEMRQMRDEQRELVRAVEQLTQTFRNLAVHLGIAAEPYAKSGKGEKAKADRDIPGFA
ncbi:MAG: hypothetical protein WB778_03550 [Thermoplasmata archaeon]